MTKQTLIATATKILWACSKIPQGAPSGHLYAALMNQVDLDTYYSILDMMKDSGMITVTSHVVKITAEGRKMVADSEAGK